MDIKIGSITLSSHTPESFTQAYQAGIITAMVENFLPQEFKVSFVECLSHFHSLRELFGERLWQKLRTHHKFRSRVKVYESLTYQPFLPRSIIGGYKEFCLGYAKSHRPSRTKRKLDSERTKDLNTIITYLTQNK